jgi:hypothetical protein
MVWAVVELIIGLVLTGIGALWLFLFGIMSVFATDKPGGNPGLLAGRSPWRPPASYRWASVSGS